MLVMLMMTEALAHIHSEFLTQNLVNLFKVIFWAILLPLFRPIWELSCKESLPQVIPAVLNIELLSSPMLAVLLVQTQIVSCKSLFQLSVTSKVLKNKGATKRA